MFSTFGVHAQTSGGDQATSSTSSQGTQNTSGKTTRDGTVDNTNSFGKESRDKAGSQGATGSSMGSAQTGSGVSDTSGTSGGTNMSGKTTQGGTAGNTNSQGMESRSQSKDQHKGSGKHDSSSGSSGMSGATGGVAATGATASGGGSLAKADQKILMDMARANISEIEAGKMAQSKSQNDQVKSFAQQMIDDHSKALTELQQLAQSKGVTLPTEPDAKHKAMAAKLDKLSGDAFDKAYMAQAGLQEHKKVHSMLMSDQKRAKDPDVKAAAAKMAPVVEQHLKSAQQMPAVKSGTTSGK
jgi:predicted outer membrane protein